LKLQQNQSQQATFFVCGGELKLGLSNLARPSYTAIFCFKGAPKHDVVMAESVSTL
jgi:hypothetical protein